MSDANGTASNGPQWEKIGDSTTRTKVPGGWLYKVENYLGHISTTFVPEPQNLDKEVSRFLAEWSTPRNLDS